MKKNKIIKFIFNIIIISIIIMPVALFVYYYWFYTPSVSIFICDVNVTSTSDGWIIKLKAEVNYNIKLSKLYYIIYNSSQTEHMYKYEEGYVSSIKNKPSPLGIIFYDVDNDNLLSDEDYMFIPKHENNSTLKYPHSGDWIIFSYEGCSGCECAILP